jgi:hypothetical protein
VPCERRFDFHPRRQQSLMIGCLGAIQELFPTFARADQGKTTTTVGR